MALGVGRALAVQLIVLNFGLDMIVLGLAGWAFNRGLGGNFATFGNSVTEYTVIFSLIAGVAGIASVLAGVHHMRVWRTDSLGSAQSTSLISWLLTLLALGLSLSGMAAKEIHVGGRNARLQTLESLVIILAFTKLLYLLSLHAGIFNDKYAQGLTASNKAGVTGNAGSTAASAV